MLLRKQGRRRSLENISEFFLPPLVISAYKTQKKKRIHSFIPLFSLYFFFQTRAFVLLQQAVFLLPVLHRGFLKFFSLDRKVALLTLHFLVCKMGQLEEIRGSEPRMHIKIT